MKMVDLIPFEPEHILRVNLRGDEATSAQYKDSMYEWAKVCHANGPSFTAVEGDKILCCAGLKVVKEGVGEGWMVLAEEGTDKKYAKNVYVQTLLHLGEMIKDLNLHRIQAWVRCDFPLGVKFLEGMGFEREGIMRKYDVDKMDCYLYSLIVEE